MYSLWVRTFAKKRRCLVPVIGQLQRLPSSQGLFLLTEATQACDWAKKESLKFGNTIARSLPFLLDSRSLSPWCVQFKT